MTNSCSRCAERSSRFACMWTQLMTKSSSETSSRPAFTLAFKSATDWYYSLGAQGEETR